MNVRDIKRRLLVKYSSFGSVVAHLKYIESKDIETAATDGKNVFFNPDFMEKLSDDQQTFVFAHEVGHVIFNHVLKSEGKDHKLWNIATDAVINAYLEDDGLEIIEGAVNIPDAMNYRAEELYERLLQEQQKKEQENNGGEQSNQESYKNGNTKNSNNQSQNNNADQKSDVGHDTHSLWEKAVEEHKKSQENKNQQDNDQISQDSNSQSQINDLIDKLSKIGEKEAFAKNKEERREKRKQEKERRTKQAIGVGNTTNSIERSIENIGAKTNLIDWRRLLKEAIKSNVDWSYKNAIIEDGVLTPQLEKFPKPETEILLDTSGSISKELLRNFLRECKSIIKASKVKVGCFDTKFYGFQEIHNEEDINNMKFKGGGGTDFNEAIKAFSRRVENKIIFTDGESIMPNDPVKAIWIVFGGKKISPKGGRVINISDEQLRELCNCSIQDTER